jgi:transcription antitermination factor NusG
VTHLDNAAELRPTALRNDSEGSVASLRMSCGRHTGARWYCVWTNPQREYHALQALVANRWDCYLPLTVARGSYRPDRIVPLFNRYLFVAFDQTCDQWGGICRTPGVGGIIRHGWETPTPLPRGVVEHLLARTSQRGVVDDPGSAPRTDIPHGASVEVRDGPLAGLQGVCSRSGPERVLVLLRLFAGVVPVSLPVTSLAVVP